MIRVVKFKKSLMHLNLEKSVEDFIAENHISQKDIVSIVPSTAAYSGGRTVAHFITLTYNDGR